MAGGTCSITVFSGKLIFKEEKHSYKYNLCSFLVTLTLSLSLRLRMLCTQNKVLLLVVAQSSQDPVPEYIMYSN